ncbi:glycosyl transferase family protein [Sporocytophaga myxococcoides]|uniref:Glycosyl transferase family protein n=1 Tax=Sporocytophaga myxococcoides TaxID=153721 RepID=A0A098LG59_9BACT|nr:glycosyltransferase family 9 protein [Sporocytophaga myxococcoides]GAL85961.1 glycosyl transferase family protein [Sporocytophaga myxococcoides]
MVIFKEWKDLRNILCIRLDNMGDVLMTTPALRALKDSFPERKITLLTSSAGKAVAQFIPTIDKVIVFDTPWVKNNGTFSSSKTFEMIELLKRENFDGAIIFTVYSQNPLPAAMLCHLAEIPKVLGYCRENPYHLISEWVPEEEPLTEIKHEVIRQLDLVGYAGCYIANKELNICLPSDYDSDITELLKGKGIKQGNYIVIHPGASEEKRMFPLDKFSEAANLLVDRLGIPVVVTGNKEERKLAEEIERNTDNKVINLAGELDLSGFIALIKKAKVVVSNNTGTVHIAAATQTPVVVLYALTNPQHAPWCVPHVVLPFDVPADMLSKNTIINYAYQKSFINKPKEITPEVILSAVKQLIEPSQEFNLTKLVQT